MKIDKIQKIIEQIYHALEEAENKADDLATAVHSDYRLSAKNLFRYLILRTYDLRKVHDHLSDLGISSIRSAEGYVFNNISNALKLLSLLQGKQAVENKKIERIGYRQSKTLLALHSASLFQHPNTGLSTQIMVTLPENAASDKQLICDLAIQGMDMARINLGHGNFNEWKNMVQHIREINTGLESPIKIYMDLAGPKIRTADIAMKKKGNGRKTNSFIRLEEGDHLILTKKAITGEVTKIKSDDASKKYTQAKIQVSLPQIVDDLQLDEPVFIDDGMIHAQIIEKRKDEVELLIKHTYKSKLGSQKGINLPMTKLHLPSLTETDLELLPFACQYADMIGYSFVQNANDVKTLYQQLDQQNDRDTGVIFKIETQSAFENLPLILLEGMKRKRIGVMIARGDLAVELGFERISEVQNEILWLCEAAHIPVIWATQVLETLAKKGKATRAEITDASISSLAECVMLNKGPYILKAVKTLKNINNRMETHTFKKKSTLRPLKVASNALEYLNQPSTTHAS